MSCLSNSNFLEDMLMKKLAIFFPGAGYGMDCPLLYYADFLYETLGFERLKLNYQNILCEKELPLEEKLCQLRSYIHQHLENIDFGSYDEIIFIAKSIGCTEAGLVAEKYIIPSIENTSAKFHQIFLTPVFEALPFCDTKCHVIIGTNDKAYSLFQEHCTAKHIPLFSVEGGDHSLEIAGKPLESIDVLKKVLGTLYE